MAILIKLCEEVHDEATLIIFIKALIEDFQHSEKLEAETPSNLYTHAALGWENTSIDTFLEAAIAWAGDVPKENENPWQRVAQILYAGKIYE